MPMRTAEQLIAWGVMPHTKLSASALGLDADGNQESWNTKLQSRIPDAHARAQFIQPLVQADIGVWMPWI